MSTATRSPVLAAKSLRKAGKAINPWDSSVPHELVTAMAKLTPTRTEEAQRPGPATVIELHDGSKSRAKRKAAPVKAAPAPTQTQAKKAVRTAQVAAQGAALHRVSDSDKVKRGFLRDYVDFALQMGTFEREQLVIAFGHVESEERLVRYFGYCVVNGIFAPVAQTASTERQAEAPAKTTRTKLKEAIDSHVAKNYPKAERSTNITELAEFFPA